MACFIFAGRVKNEFYHVQEVDQIVKRLVNNMKFPPINRKMYMEMWDTVKLSSRIFVWRKLVKGMLKVF